MKRIEKNYEFDSSSGQITFSNYTTISIECLILITNITKNVIIFNFADPDLKGSVSGNVLTLEKDTTDMSSNDNLQIYYESPDILECGGKIIVGTTPVEVTFSGQTKAISITADDENSVNLFVGGANVTSSGANAGWKLKPDDSLTFEFEDSDFAIYVVAESEGQYFWKGGIV